MTNSFSDDIDNIWFLYNGNRIQTFDYNKKLNEYFFTENVTIFVNGNITVNNFKIIETIKDNVYTTVYKAVLPNGRLVAVKKIHKEKLKDEMKFSRCQEEITDEEFQPEIEKFNKEIKNMKRCKCENSVEIIDYYDTKEDFIIVMELCDETLFHILCRKKPGFSAEEIKEVLLQLNNVFKLMNNYKIAHRDIKLNNILVKYLNEEKTKYKVLLSDYGISNHLNSLASKFVTHAGTQLIMAPEILNGKNYNNKCDLWSLGIIIFQLYTKKFPYSHPVEKGILEQIESKGKTVLNVIKDEKLKDLLSKLLESDPQKRISWKKYFKHSFFKNKDDEVNEENNDDDDDDDDEDEDKENKKEDKKEDKKDNNKDTNKDINKDTNKDINKDNNLDNNNQVEGSYCHIY
mgnify:FL=1